MDHSPVPASCISLVSSFAVVAIPWEPFFYVWHCRPIWLDHWWNCSSCFNCGMKSWPRIALRGRFAASLDLWTDSFCCIVCDSFHSSLECLVLRLFDFLGVFNHVLKSTRHSFCRHRRWPLIGSFRGARAVFLVSLGLSTSPRLISPSFSCGFVFSFGVPMPPICSCWGATQSRQLIGSATCTGWRSSGSISLRSDFAYSNSKHATWSQTRPEHGEGARWSTLSLKDVQRRSSSGKDCPQKTDLATFAGPRWHAICLSCSGPWRRASRSGRCSPFHWESASYHFCFPFRYLSDPVSILTSGRVRARIPATPPRFHYGWKRCFRRGIAAKEYDSWKQLADSGLHFWHLFEMWDLPQDWRRLRWN